MSKLTPWTKVGIIGFMGVAIETLCLGPSIPGKVAVLLVMAMSMIIVGTTILSVEE